MDAELVAWREQVETCADSRLMAELHKLVRADRRAEVRVLVVLGELDERRLVLEHAYSSLYTYATGVLRMSEAQAYLRIQAARLARRFPVILEMLWRGELNLSTLKLLDRHLTVENHVALLERARHKTKREVELLVAELAPRPDVPTRMRKLPVRSALKQTKEPNASRPAPGACDAAQSSLLVQPARAKPAAVEQVVVAGTSGGSPGSAAHVAASVVAPAASSGDAGQPVTFALEAPRASLSVLGPRSFEFKMTAGQELYDKVKQLQHLLRHQVPGGDVAAIIERAVDDLLEKTLKQRFAQVSKPRTSASKSREVGVRERVDAAAARNAAVAPPKPVDGESARLTSASASREVDVRERADAAVAHLDASTTIAVSPRKPVDGESVRLTSASESREVDVRERADAAAARDGAAAHVDASSTTVVAPRKPVDGESARPRQPCGKDGRSRYIPRAVVREVFARDGARCTFVSASGQRCAERGMLELHHVRAFALGGRSTVENLTLVCRAHNGFFAVQDFGAEHMRSRRASSRSNSDQPSCSDFP